MSTQSDFTFEMDSLRRDVLAIVAVEIRKGSPQEAKIQGKREIKTRSMTNAREHARAFVSAFDRALKMLEKGGDYIEVLDTPPIVEDHDAEIDPETEIHGEIVGTIRAHHRSGERETKTYPVVQEEKSGFRVCTCGEQKEHTVCEHTLARVIERNWGDAPVPTGLSLDLESHS